MPKDYRDRRIDNKPPKAAPTAKQPKQTTTEGNPGNSEVEPEEVYIPVPDVAIAPGDGVLWFLRRDTSAGAPSGRGVTLKTLAGGSVTFSYVALPGGWTNYITSFVGNQVYQADGVTLLTDETVYVIWDQFTGFTGGDYKLSFTHSGTVDKAIMLRNVSTSSPGTFYSGMAQTPTWSKTYVSNEVGDITNNFPRTFSMGGSGVARVAYAVYQMSGGVQAPAAIYSAPGQALLSYTVQNPADQPYFTRSIVTFYADTLPTTTSLEVLAPWENGWGGAI